jgi:eukaryotic-like serine/threonine-protein kinase
MDPRWTRITDLFDAALGRDPSGRGPFLDDACAGDASLRAEVESLLAAHERAGGFMDRPAPVAAGFVSEEPVDVAAPGQMIGPFRVAREIGRGGMGVVYEAEDTRLGRQVALKVLTPSLAADPTMRARLRREARAAAALSDPAIATVFSFEEFDGRACLATELVPGETLRAEIARGPLALDAVLDTGIRLARGLASAHAAGIVHRDLKPDNVVRSRRGDVKILDFGIAHVDVPTEPGAPRLTRVGAVVGTPGYMSPEQLEGADVDQRSDVFALGVLLFELAAGRHPFDGGSAGFTVAASKDAGPPSLASLRPGLPERLDDVVRRCMAWRRTERYASALDVARDLEDLRDGRPGVRVPARSAAARVAGSPLWWWRVHQIVRMAVVAALVYGVWRVHVSMRNDWTLAAFLAYVVTGAINGTLRAHLLFVGAVDPGRLRDELRRAGPFVRTTDVVIALLLLLAAGAVARTQLLLPSILAAVAVGWAVITAMVEPATCKAAFPDERR